MTSDNSTKNSRTKKYISYSIPLVLMFLFLYLAFHGVDFNRVLDILSSLSLPWLLVFILSFLVSHFLRALRWKVMLKPHKKDTSLLNLFGATMIGYGVNSVVPRLGELYRGFFAGKWEDISRSVVLGTIVVERIIDILALGFSVLVSVMIFEGNLYSELEWLKSTVILGFVGIFLVIIVLFLLVRLKEKFYSLILKYAGKVSSKLAEKLAYVFKMLIDGFSTIKGVKSYLLVIIYSILIMLNYGLSAELGFYVLNLGGGSGITYSMAWIVMTISAFGIVIPTPGGIGTYHFIAISVLVGLFAFTEEMASAYALLTHTISTLIFIISMFVMMSIINIKRSKIGLAKENFFSVIKGDRKEF